MSKEERIENVLHEHRRFEPPATFAAQANISRKTFDEMYRRSLAEPDAFWSEQAEQFEWFSPFHTVLEWKEPFARWFVGGTTNITTNALDRHLKNQGNKLALVWEGESGEVRRLSYRELHEAVCRFANALGSLGIKPGDRVTIYLPMIPEAVIAMLACARVGATHSVVFGGFSATALADRIEDAQSMLVITADGGYRRGAVVPLKANLDEALNLIGQRSNNPVKQVIVVRRTGEALNWQAERDLWYEELMAKSSSEHPAAALEAEHPLFILYTSGSTGKPKGVLHTTGGYMVWTALTAQTVFDLKPDDLYWCTADIGWITGHSYVVYGPLLNGASIFIYEGAPNHPGPDRFWELIDKHKISIFYTAPTAIRAFMRSGETWPAKHDLSSLRLLGTVGEPINPEAWLWYRRVIGGNKLPIVDTWWQTETGGIMITTLPGAHASKPGSAGVPMFGIDAAILDHQGNELGANEGGLLAIRKPWPGMLRTIYGDPERYTRQYWAEIPHCYFAGDGARRDEEGYFTIVGRIDDVLNVSGHRLGTMEVESALVDHPAVAEAAVVGRPDPLKGEVIIAFVTLKSGSNVDAEELRNHVSQIIGAIARPEEVHFSEALPKTRSGKIMRRLLRQIAAHAEISGDISTLEDASVLERLREE